MNQHLEAILIGSIGITAITLQMVYLLKDDRTPNHTKEDLTIKKYWHLFGGVLHIWVGYMMEKLYGPGWGLMMGSTMWLVFDGIVNSWVLNKEWWYIGTTAWLDKAQVTIAGYIHMDPRTLSAILKLSFFIGSIVNLIL